MIEIKLFGAIKRKCIECSGGITNEVTGCQIKKCPLYPYRLGGESDKRGYRQMAKEKAGAEKKKNTHSHRKGTKTD